MSFEFGLRLFINNLPARFFPLTRLFFCISTLLVSVTVPSVCLCCVIIAQKPSNFSDQLLSKSRTISRNSPFPVSSIGLFLFVRLLFSRAYVRVYVTHSVCLCVCLCVCFQISPADFFVRDFTSSFHHAPVST